MSTTSVVDLSGDGGVTREVVQEGDGKGLATGDIAMVRFTGTVAKTGQVCVFLCRYASPLPPPPRLACCAGFHPCKRKTHTTSRYANGLERGGGGEGGYS